MINYSRGAYGVHILFRLHGSAAYKTMTPCVFSTMIYIVLSVVTDLETDEENIFDHPYAIGALMAAFTFLLTFKAQFSYNRYWEATTAIHQMHSKWIDVGMDLAAFHLQSNMYRQKPPAFGANPHLEERVKARRRLHEPTLEQVQAKLDASEAFITEQNNRLRRRRLLMVTNHEDSSRRSIRTRPSTLMKIGPLKAVDPKTEHPSLFLQESAHLLSLLSAVAMATLRNDVEGAESPLIPFEIGLPWPQVDPDHYSADIRKGWSPSRFKLSSVLRYTFGLARSPKQRTLYNAARPFRVIGGISDNEIRMLQTARGPFAKVALCSFWLQEFISRETLNGSVGKVAPPILSRLYQYVSDGMLGYNQARKVAIIPFPFPHAQITALFVVVVCAFIPVLMLSFVANLYYGAVLNLITVMCFAGLHEVSRELENPFTAVPNDLPLNFFQAEFNEALMNMYVGYHPDSYWDEEDDDEEEEGKQEDEAPLLQNSKVNSIK